MNVLYVFFVLLSLESLSDMKMSVFKKIRLDIYSWPDIIYRCVCVMRAVE